MNIILKTKAKLEMRRLLFILLATIATVTTFTSCEKDRDVIIEFNELPSAAQSTIDTHFDKSQILLVTYDKSLFDKDFSVAFYDGTIIDFDKDGAWESITSASSGLPNSIIPSSINEFVTKTYPSAKVIELDKDKQGYEVKLDNKMEFSFNLSGVLTEIEGND